MVVCPDGLDGEHAHNGLRGKQTVLCAYRGFGAVVAELCARHCVIEDLDVGDDVAVGGRLLKCDELVGSQDGLCWDLEGCDGHDVW